MKLEKGKIYKCLYTDESYCFSFTDGEFFYKDSDLIGYNYSIDDFDKVEPVSVDTLEEVVDWCKREKKCVTIGADETIYLGWAKIEATEEFTKPSDLLTHIRNDNKGLDELKALAERLGYELTKKD